MKKTVPMMLLLALGAVGWLRGRRERTSLPEVGEASVPGQGAAGPSVSLEPDRRDVPGGAYNVVPLKGMR